MYSVTCSGLFRSAFLLILISCLLVDSIVYLLKFWFFMLISTFRMDGLREIYNRFWS